MDNKIINKKVMMGITSLTICGLIGTCGCSEVSKHTLDKDFNNIGIENKSSKININEKYDKFMLLATKSHNDMVSKELKKQEQIRLEKIKQQKIKSEQIKKYHKKKVHINRGLTEEGEWRTFTCSFYTGLVRENSKYGAVNCKGKRLFDGVCASNIISYGTKIYTKVLGELIVYDNGGDHFDNPNRLDIYVPQRDDENEDEYYRRVNNMGKIKIRGFIVKNK